MNTLRSILFKSKIGRMFYAKLLLVSMLFSLFLPVGMVSALSANYILTVNQPVNLVGLTLNLSGTASANPYVGQFGAQHVFVDWGDGAKSPTSNENFILNNGAKSFSGTWSNSHTYAASGNYNIVVTLYHSKPKGNEGDDAIFKVNVIVPPQVAHLTVIKNVVNDNGGTKTPADFTMNVTGTNVSTPSFPGSSVGTTVTLDPGSYSIDETPDSGYNKSLSVDCSGTIAAGETKTCTVTNNDRQATLIVKKHVVNDNGGQLTAPDFTMTVDGTNASKTSFPGNENGTTVTMDAGFFSVDEIDSKGYDESEVGACSGNIANGETKTCTIVNDDKVQVPQTATLIVKKHVVNDNGGTLSAGAFTLNVSGPSAQPASFAGNENGTTVTVTPGTYSVDELNAPGYDKSFDGDCSNVNIDVGQTKTCTVTNNDQPATLIVKKVVINDNGGQLASGDFTMNVSGTNVSNTSFPGDENGTAVTLNAGSYSIDEGDTKGYLKSVSADCSGTIANGETKTCTITNDDPVPPSPTSGTLIVKKHVINDDGGVLTASAFAMTVSGPNANPASFAGDENGTSVTVDPGTYSVDEVDSLGYEKSFDGDCSNVTIAAGETKTCTITNNDPKKQFICHATGNGSFDVLFVPVNDPVHAGHPNDIIPITDVNGSGGDPDQADCIAASMGTLKVIKIVKNDNGGTKTPADFTMNVTGPSPSSFPGDANGTTLSVLPGTYSVDENDAPDYAKSFDGDCTNVAIAAGETKTCSITNDDKPATLVVKKHVINDNGGQKTAADFTINVDGTNVDKPSFPGDENGTTVTLDAGSYSVDEANAADYNKSLGVDCSGTIANGESKTCTVTNDDIVIPVGGGGGGQNTATIIVKKHVINDDGGKKTAGDFNLTVTGPSANPSSFTGDENGTTVTVTPGTYSVDEAAAQGYKKSLSADCTNVVIAAGETKTCTVTNDDIAPPNHSGIGTLIVKKHVINNNGGNKAAGDFTLTVTGPSANPSSFAGDENGTSVTVAPGTYSVDEDAAQGYKKSLSGDCTNVVIAAGETKTCTVTNDDMTPPSHGGGGGGGGNPGGGGTPHHGGGGGGTIPKNPPVVLASEPDPICDKDKFNDYKSKVAQWLTCDGIAHGYSDNDKFYSPNDEMNYGHFVKMLARASRKVTTPHKKGSGVEQYFDVLIKAGIPVDKRRIHTNISPNEAMKFIKLVSGQNIQFSNFEKLSRNEVAEKLYDLFADKNK